MRLPDRAGIAAELAVEAVNVALAAEIPGANRVAGGERMEGQPAGTMHLALAHEDGVEYSTFRYDQGREQSKRRIVLQSLTMLRRHLMERAARG